MAGIIDFHTHAFSDELAARAMKSLRSLCPQIRPFLNGTISELLDSMDLAGVERSVICSIATKPGQFEPILDWSLKIASDRIIPFASIHPDDAELPEKIIRVKNAGIKGLKIHPYYQDFYLDEEKMLKYYEKVCDAELILVSHTGYDVAFEHIKRAEPERVLNVLAHFPDLKFVTTHLGAWQDWDDTEKYMLGKKIYMEISFAFGYLPDEKIQEILTGHPADFLLFGSDSPWTGQAESLGHLRKLKLLPSAEEKILHTNAVRLLGL